MTYLEMFGRITLAIFLGGIIGLERESRNRPAGFRTHTLVSLGACIVVICSELVFVKYYTDYAVSFDPTRMGAQVISGIGFLGAGTIMRYGGSITGLTTAASLWTVACVGLVVGFGNYALAVMASIILFVVLRFFDKLRSKIDHRYIIRDVMIQIRDDCLTLGTITEFLTKSNAKIISISHIKEDELEKLRKVVKYEYKLMFESIEEKESILRQVSELEGISEVEVVQ